MNRDDFYAFCARRCRQASIGPATEPQLYERLTQHPRPPVFGAPQGPVKPWESSEAWRETFETLFVSEPPSVPAAAGLYAILNLKESFDESMLMQHVEALIGAVWPLCSCAPKTPPKQPSNGPVVAWAPCWQSGPSPSSSTIGRDSLPNLGPSGFTWGKRIYPPRASLRRGRN